MSSLEYLLEVVDLAAGRFDPLASAHLPHQLRLGAHVVTGDIAAIAGGVQALDRLAVNLGQKNVRDRFDHSFRRALQQVGDAHVHHGLAQADGVIHVGEGIELDPKFRHGSARPELAVGALKNVVEMFPQDVINLSRRERLAIMRRQIAWLTKQIHCVRFS